MKELRLVWISMKQARNSKLYVQSQLGSDVTADKETKAEWRATIKDQDKLANSMLPEICTLYSGDSEAVGRDTENSKYEAFKVPKHLDDRHYKEFKESYCSYMDWRSTLIHSSDHQEVLLDTVRSGLHLRCSWRCGRNALDTSRQAEGMD